METSELEPRAGRRRHLETFLVEWKQPLHIDQPAHGVGPLETFLVEWKQPVGPMTGGRIAILETFLVEWKPFGLCLCCLCRFALKPS